MLREGHLDPIKTVPDLSYLLPLGADDLLVESLGDDDVLAALVLLTKEGGEEQKDDGKAGWGEGFHRGGPTLWETPRRGHSPRPPTLWPRGEGGGGTASNERIYPRGEGGYHCQWGPTILAVISRSIVLAAATPLGSPSMRITLLFSSSGGMMMEVPVSVFIRFTGRERKETKWREEGKGRENH